MKVLITGATGLIGSSICARLIKEGHSVVAVIRPGGGIAPFGVTETIRLDVSAAVATSDWAPPFRVSTPSSTARAHFRQANART